VVTRYPARTHEGDLQNMTDQNAQAGPESKPDADGVACSSSIKGASGHNKDEVASSKNPAPGVVITPPAGIQWQKGTTYALEAKVVDNTLLPESKITGDLLPTFK
jgi:hypothetical protein